MGKARNKHIVLSAEVGGGGKGGGSAPCSFRAPKIRVGKLFPELIR